MDLSHQGSSIHNETQNEVLIPMPKHVQEIHSPDSTQIFRALAKSPQQIRHMKSPNRNWVVDSKGNENGEKKSLKQKRYRKPNSKKKTSVYRGVTKCKGRFESFVWDNIGGKKGKTVYVGGFQDELEAARAHDLIAIKIWGKFANTNFPESCYLKEISEMENMSKRECILAVRRSKNEGILAQRKQIGYAFSLSNERDNEECDASMLNNRDLEEEHVTISPPLDSLRNPHGINFSTGIEVEMEQNSAIGDALPNPTSANEESTLQDIGQLEAQAPIGMQNEHFENLFLDQFEHAYDDHSWPHLEFDSDLSFQNDLSVLFGPTFDCESSLLDYHTNGLGNVLNWESSMCQMGDKNALGTENGDVGSSGLCSLGFDSLDPNIQQFEAPNPLEFGANTSSQDKNMVIDNDFDISNYLSQSP